jgi:TP901 family phage tail tape measure protein
MSAAASRISVVVDADSVPFQENIGKAGDAEREFIDTVLKAAKDAIAANEATAKSNTSVSDSYGRMAGAVGVSVSEMVKGLRAQAVEQGELAAGAAKMSAAIVEAARTQAEAYGSVKDQLALFGAEQAEHAGQMQMFAFKEEAAYSAVADAAVASADRQIGADAKVTQAANARADKQVAAADRSRVAQEKSFGATGTGLVTLGKRTLEAAAVTAGASLYASSKFEASMTRMQTQAGATARQAGLIGPALQKMAGQVGRTPDELAEGMYHIVSSMNAVLPPAHATAEELTIFKKAAELAAVGNTGIVETSYMVGSAMNALHLRAKDATKAVGDLNAIVGSGDMTLQDFDAAMTSGVLPTAQAFGTSLQSVGAAMDTFGDEGIRGAQAGNKLRMMFALLGGPTQKSAEILKAVGVPAGEMKTKFAGMTKALEKAGVSTTQISEDLRKPDGLYAALEDLKTHLENSGLGATQSAAVISRAFGGGRTGGGITLLIQNLHRLQAKYAEVGHKGGDFNKDWAKQQETLKQQVDDLGGSLAALGVKIGTDLTPDAEKMLKVFKGTAEWLDHNKTAADALAISLGGIAVVSAAAFGVNKVSKGVEGLRNAARQVGLTSGSTADGLRGQISGAHGVVLPGSMENPVVVAQEAGRYAGLGGEAAASGAVAGSEGEVKQAASEGKAAEVGLPVAGEEAAVGGTALASLKSGLSTVMANAMKGGLVGVGGVIASELAGSAIGGKTGSDVSSIGKDTALGAAIGTTIEPGIGTAIGGGLGAIAGGLKALAHSTAQEHTESLFHGKGKPNLSGTKQAAEAAKILADEEEEIAALAARRQHRHRGFGRSHPEETDPTAPAQLRIEERRQEEAGSKLGEAEKGFVLGGTKNPGIESIIRTSKADLEKLKPIGREGFAGFIASMVESLEHDGRLPHDSLQKVIGSLKPLLENLPHTAAASAAAFSQQFVGNLHAQQMLSAVSTVTSEITKNWDSEYGVLPITTHMKLAEVERTANTDLGSLTWVMKHRTGEQREEAEQEYKKLASSLGAYMAAAKANVKTELGALSKETGPEAAKGVAAVIAKWAELPASLKTQLNAAGGEVHKGIEKMNKELFNELKTLNGGKVTTLAEGGAPLAPGVESQAEHHKAAQGGLFQLGNRGDAGKDTIPLSVGGQNIMAGAGETAAIFTRHQRADIETRLPGGLPSVFANKRPNFMASGGFVAGPGTNYTVGEEPQIVKDLQRLGEYLHTTLEGISGYRTPQHSIEVGGFANDPHTRGEASDTLGTQTVPASVLARFGLERPFPGAAEADHMQLLGSLGHPHGGVASGVAGGLAAEAVAQITPPKVDGKGIVAQIAQAALNKVAGAANAKLGATGGSGGGIGSGFHGAWTQVMAQIAAAKHWSLPDWRQVVQLESGGDPRSVNSSSGAFGLGQALGATKTEFPKMVSANPSQQIEGMAEYIAGRYGNPTAALAHEHEYHWYEQGGIVEGLTASATPKQKVKLPKAPKLKKAGAGHKPSPNIASLIHGLGAVPDTENVKALQPFPPLLEQLANTHTLLGKIEGIPDRYVVGDDGMAHLKPTIQPGQHFTAGMTVTDAQREQVAANTRAKGESTPITEQGEILAWLGELPSHHLLNASDVGMLKDGRLTAGMQMGAASESVTGSELGENVRLVEAEGAVQATWEGLVGKYKDRQATIRHHQEVEFRRYSKIKQQIARLTTGQLRARVAAAQSKDYKDELIADAHASDEAVTENIAGEKGLPAKSQNKKLIAELEAEKRHIAGYVRGLSKPASQTGAALVNLRKNELKNELTPLEENLGVLGGSRTAIGHGGDYGKVGGYIKKLNEGVTRLGSEIATENSGTIPSLKVELETLAAENRDANLKPAPAGLTPGETAQEAQLNALLKEQAQQLSETIATQGAQLHVLAGFIPQIPKYEHGGPVIDTGLAELHKGEHVVPVGGALVATGGGPPIVHIENNVHGEGLAALGAFVDSRIQHPDNVTGVSRQIARRSNMLPKVPRR